MRGVLAVLVALPLMVSCYCSGGVKGTSAISDLDVKVLKAVALGEDGYFKDVPKRNVIDFPDREYVNVGDGWVFELYPDQGDRKPPINGYFTKVVLVTEFAADGEVVMVPWLYEFVVTDVCTAKRPFWQSGLDDAERTVYSVHVKPGGRWPVKKE